MDNIENTLGGNNRGRRNLKKLSKFPLKKILISVGIFLFILILVAFLGLVLPGKAVYDQALRVKAKAQETQASLATKDLQIIETKLQELEEEVNLLDQKYQRLKLTGFLPYLSKYYEDGNYGIKAAQTGIETGKTVIEAVKPYQDFLGLKASTENEELKDSKKSTEERISFLVESIEGIKPHLDEIDEQLNTIDNYLQEIEPQDYPSEFRGYQIKKLIGETQNNLNQVTQFVHEGRPLIENIDWLLGKDKPRQYLFLFQNDGELRPTGGFWTAYGIIEVDEGNFTPKISEDIYALDARFNSNIEAPRPIKEFHKNVYYLHLRDINLSPDFPTSVQEFNQHYQDLPNAVDFDGVFAVDTQVLVDVLEVLGQIGVPGWGNFSAEPDERCWGCPQVVYQLENYATKPVSTIRTNRKSFLAPMMHSIISNALGSPKEELGVMVNMVWQNLMEKHILVYFPDDKLQKAAEKLNIAGSVRETETDYLYLVDSNFAGAKSNLFIDQGIKHEIEIAKDKIIHKVTVEYKNTAPASNCNLEAGELCLNGLYRNWFRFYVPQQAKLVKMTGSEIEANVYEEQGKKVFEGFYGDKYPLYPKGSTKVSIEYEIDWDGKKPHPILIQKQPGKEKIKYEVYLQDKLIKEFDLKTDRTLELSW